MIQVTREMQCGWCVVSVQGRADAATADDLEAALRSALEQNARVAVNCAALNYISSAGLRAVLQAARAAQERNAEFAICSLSPPARRVFDLSGMHHLVRIESGLPC